MKTAICAIVKTENLYINEWINYHLDIGFDKIFLYDNNDSDGEKLSDVINSDKVEIIDFKDKKYAQRASYTKCFKENKHLFDWIAFIDIDEFIMFKDKSMNIKQFLQLDQFKNANVIRLNWKHFSDNNLLDVVNDDYSVVSRFTEEVKHKKDVAGKAIVRCTLNYTGWIGGHGPLNVDAVDENGKPCMNESYIVSKVPSYNIAWVNHYHTKTIGEYIRQKWFRGECSSPQFADKYSNFEHFFEYCKSTPEKLQYGQKILSEYESSSLLHS